MALESSPCGFTGGMFYFFFSKKGEFRDRNRCHQYFIPLLLRYLNRYDHNGLNLKIIIQTSFRKVQLIRMLILCLISSITEQLKVCSKHVL